MNDEIGFLILEVTESELKELQLLFDTPNVAMVISPDLLAKIKEHLTDAVTDFKKD